MIAKTEDFIRKNIAGQKTKQAQSRRKMLEKLDRLERHAERSQAVAHSGVADRVGVGRDPGLGRHRDHLVAARDHRGEQRRAKLGERRLPASDHDDAHAGRGYAIRRTASITRS